MFRKISICIGILVLSLFLYSCATISKLAEPVQEEKLIITPPARKVGDINKQPAHVKFVMAAIVNKMRGNRDLIPEVVFDPNGKHLFHDPEFTYDDFDLYLTEITGFEILNQSKTKAQMVIEGALHFKDIFGRGIVTYYAVDYTVRKGGITVNKSGTALIAPSSPDLETYFVPRSSFAGVNMKKMSSFMDLYIHSVLNSLTMEPTDEERKKQKAYQQLSFWQKMKAGMKNPSDNYFIMVFCKDRLPPEAMLKMKVTEEPKMHGAELAETIYIYDNGWRVMVAGGRFNPDVRETKFYVNLQYNTDPSVKPESIQIGTFSNQKNYNSRPKQILKRKIQKDAASSVSQPEESPIASGKVFLNPLQKKDAELIQARLARLGYYNLKVDGLFGKSSRNALKQFKQDNSLGNNTVWDIQTQKALFTNSGL